MTIPTQVDPYRFGEGELRTMAVHAPDVIRFMDFDRKPKMVYIIRGEVTELRQQELNVPAGTTSWEFSDGPINRVGKDGRCCSTDYLDLKEGLDDHVGYAFNIDEANFTPEEQSVFDLWVADHD